MMYTSIDFLRFYNLKTMLTFASKYFVNLSILINESAGAVTAKNPSSMEMAMIWN